MLDRLDQRRKQMRERQRRCRERKRQGCATYPVEVGEGVIDTLVRLGWLRDADATRPRCVARAISALLADVANRGHT